MLRIFSTLTAAVAIAALVFPLECGAQAFMSQPPSVTRQEPSPGPADISAFMKEKLCHLCHTQEPLSKASAPSYAEVARKYKGNPSALEVVAKHIALGSRGQWGNQYMTAYDAAGQRPALMTAIAKFVLSQGR